MKHLISTLIIALFLTIFVSGTAFATSPPPPPPGHGSSGNVPGGGAPIEGGIAILLSLGLGYAGMKVYRARRKALVE
ncbi:MAG: hypothetical protein KKA81_14390 [Bacteroidetes bacterium]|nr:hypothetical protein [Bacteroidota bacterium]